MTWLALVPMAVFLLVFGWCILTAEDDPNEPRPKRDEPPMWRGGWRT